LPNTQKTQLLQKKSRLQKTPRSHCKKNTTVAKKNWELLQNSPVEAGKKNLPDTQMVTVANNTTADGPFSPSLPLLPRPAH